MTLNNHATIETNLERQDYRAFQRYVIFEYRRFHWFFMLGLLLNLSFYLAAFHDRPIEAQIVAMAVGLILFFGVMIVMYVILRVLAFLTGSKPRPTLGPHVFQIGEDTITEANSDGRQEMRFSAIKRVAETGSHFFVFAMNGTALIIPKRDVSDAAPLLSMQKRVAEGI